MKSQFLNFKIYFRFLVLVVGLCMLTVLVTHSTATSALTISIVNNGGSEICHFYLSPPDNDNWGPDQLNETGISPGATRNLEVSWDQATVKLVAEDQDGRQADSTGEHGKDRERREHSADVPHLLPCRPDRHSGKPRCEIDPHGDAMPGAASRDAGRAGSADLGTCATGWG